MEQTTTGRDERTDARSEGRLCEESLVGGRNRVVSRIESNHDPLTMIELLIEMVIEACLQIFGELLLELGLRSLEQPFEKRECRNPVLAFVGYFIFGTLAGAVSLFPFPRSFISHSRFHGLSLFLAPLLAGLTMSGLGRWRQRHGKPVFRLDSFAYGFIFAFGMALIRFFFTTKP